jgi:urea transport system permease protein
MAALFLCTSAWALDRAQVEKLAADDNDEKIAAIAALVAEGDPKAADVLRQAAEGEITIEGKKVEVVMNNRVRGRIAEALSVLKLLSLNSGERLEAAKALAGGADSSMLPLILKAKDKETDADIKALLEMTAASMQMRSEDRATRLAAIRTLGESANPNARALLTEAASDSDADIRAEALRSLSGVQSRLVWGEWLGLAFAGVSLGSILLLAALGLAITYGLMGVINMAHG